jgi:predicted nuclease of predicted toxin-antitoxin system
VAPRFLLDEHISPDVARGCGRRGVDVLSAADAGLLQADDIALFRAAIQKGRIIVTYNTGDFARLFGDLLKEGAAIPGLVFVDARTISPSDIGGQVRALVRLAALIERGAVDPSGGVFLSR